MEIRYPSTGILFDTTKLFLGAKQKPMRLITRVILSFSILSTLSLHAQAQQPIPSYSATYKAKYKNIKVKAKRELKHLGNGDIEVSQSLSHFLMRMDESTKITPVISGNHITLSPKHYRYSRKGVGKNKSTEIHFDSKNRKLKEIANKKEYARTELPTGIQDKLSYQLQLRLDAMHYGDQFDTRHYPYIENGKAKQYSFRKLADETLKTGLGKIETAVFERVRENNSKRSTKIWLAKDWGYLIARIEQKENGSSKYALELESATIGKQAIHAFDSEDEEEGDFGFGVD